MNDGIPLPECVAEYEKMTWKTPSHELVDAIEDLIQELKSMRNELDKAKFSIEVMRHFRRMENINPNTENGGEKSP
tara:strand:- start:727 stop:954 length:228 start_codon:yes stop_codon:yes gene_type:complete